MSSRLDISRAFPLGRDARRHVAAERLRAFPFRRDEARQGYVARCPDCEAEVGFVTEEWVARSEHREPPTFCRGPHACPSRECDDGEHQACQSGCACWCHGGPTQPTPR